MYERDGQIVFEGVTSKIGSPDALLCHIPDLDGDIWVPHSQITDDSGIFKPNQHEPDELVVTMWLAEERGWV